MASEVVRSGRVDPRSYRVFGLVQFAILAVSALVVAAGGTGPSGTFLPAPAFFGAGVVVLVFWWWAIPQVAASWVVEIDQDAIRWHGGWRKRDRVVRRAQVAAARPNGNPRFLQLRFYDAAGPRVGMLPLFQFPTGRVIAVLQHHGWPVPAPEQFFDGLRWGR